MLARHFDIAPVPVTLETGVLCRAIDRVVVEKREYVPTGQEQLRLTAFGKYASIEFDIDEENVDCALRRSGSRFLTDFNICQNCVFMKEA